MRLINYMYIHQFNSNDVDIAGSMEKLKLHSAVEIIPLCLLSLFQHTLTHYFISRHVGREATKEDRLSSKDLCMRDENA